MSGRVNAATVIGGFLVLLGLAATFYAMAIPAEADGNIGARIFPLIGSISIAIMGVLEALRGLKGDSVPLALSQSPGAVLGLLALCIAYVWGITKFGYLLATGVAAPLAMWLFGIRSPIGLLIAALICPVIYHLIFFQLLGVFPPFGEWFDLLDLIQGY